MEAADELDAWACFRRNERSREIRSFVITPGWVSLSVRTDGGFQSWEFRSFRSPGVVRGTPEGTVYHVPDREDGRVRTTAEMIRAALEHYSKVLGPDEIGVL